jgi:hypothetical protein
MSDSRDAEENQFADSRRAFLRDGDVSLPQGLEKGGWQHLLSLLLNPEGKFHPVAVRTAEAIVSLRRQAQEPGANGRKAHSILTAAGKTLAPDLRGKRQRLRVDDADAVCWQYYREQFRWHQIRNYLSTRRTLRRDRVQTASLMYSVPVETIRIYWGLDENFERLTPPLPLKEIATIEAAHHFDITVPTVQNLLASY